MFSIISRQSRFGVMRLMFIMFFMAKVALGQNEWQDTEKELARLGYKSIAAITEEERLAVADSFSALLDQTITSQTSFSYPFESVKNLSKLIAPDKSFRIYTWSVPLKNGSFVYNGRLVLKTVNNLKVIKLTDQGDSLNAPEYRQLKASNWFGAIYYDIVQTNHKKTTYYTLLGYRPNRGSYNAKLLEVISSENLETFRFGDKIFNTPRIHGYKHKRKPYRLIFRYNPKIIATVKYNRKRKEIVMDHLSPPDASQQEDWKWYGPDFTFDALYWENSMWQLNEGIQLNNNISPTAPQQTQKGLPNRH